MTPTGLVCNGNQPAYADVYSYATRTIHNEVNMSSLNDHITQNRTQAGPQTAAKEALLNAIAKAVEDVKTEGGGLSFEIPRLKDLAEAYALVVHGKA